MIVNIYALNEIDDKDLTFFVIFSKYHAKNVYVRHKDRDTYEIPGGRREVNETADIKQFSPNLEHEIEEVF